MRNITLAPSTGAGTASGAQPRAGSASGRTAGSDAHTRTRTHTHTHTRTHTHGYQSHNIPLYIHWSGQTTMFTSSAPRSPPAQPRLFCSPALSRAPAPRQQVRSSCASLSRVCARACMRVCVRAGMRVSGCRRLCPCVGVCCGRSTARARRQRLIRAPSARRGARWASIHRRNSKNSASRRYPRTLNSHGSPCQITDGYF